MVKAVGMLGRTVVDKTGLTGKYDLDVEWTFDEAIMIQLPPDVPKPVSDGTGPSIFTALQEQLGFKLESQKGPVEVLVIDPALVCERRYRPPMKADERRLKTGWN